MSFTVYILESSMTGRLYIGQTNNFERRFQEHVSNKVVSTRNRGPWRVLKTILVETRTEAVGIELKLKKMKNPARVKSFLLRNYPD